ncbi:hypothetical protein [Motilimonas eburnea]|uniref:hypothetical protein n=1 Tax=Motilimonas eburnea TaxID=1737488 RepID=UPI001E63A8B9|nr:hypothetical protein [Motilimonas eburnea]MCE2571793.1 hypothetical protein [Motilimonas eburnea]
MNIWIIIGSIPLVLIALYFRSQDNSRSKKHLSHDKEGAHSSFELVDVDIPKEVVEQPPKRTLLLLDIVAKFQGELEHEYGIAYGYSFEQLDSVSGNECELLNLSLYYLTPEQVGEQVRLRGWPIRKVDIQELSAELVLARQWLHNRKLKISDLRGFALNEQVDNGLASRSAF